VTDQPATDDPATDEPEAEQSATDQPEAEQSATDQPEAEQSASDQPSAPVQPANHVAAPTATAVLTHVVRSIVDDADAVHVDAVEGRNRLKLEVKVGPCDLGRVIGRRGRTAQSIRTVVRAAATRDGVEVDVDFVD